MTGDITPFRIDIPEADLKDLRDRLRRTRWPEAETVNDWSQGVPLNYLRELCDYWMTQYDWRKVEARLNSFPQFRTEIDGLGIHFLHVKSPHPEAFPLIITHGWPGSVIEFLKVIEPLTNPTAYGGKAEDAFHVVCPSLPGYGFSDKPTQSGWNIEKIASAWTQLMTRLSYDRYGAQGGDWGASISTLIGQQDAEHVAGINLNPPIAAPDPATFDDLTAQEQAALDARDYAYNWDSGYSAEHSTRPQTVGYGLVDSPVMLCAWMLEKFWSWTDNDGHPENALSRDELLDDITLYWLTASGASSARLYWESIRLVSEKLNSVGGETITVPTGGSIFPHENPRPSRRWAAKRYTNIIYWHELEKGGHFAAFEQPETFVSELRAFFRLVR